MAITTLAAWPGRFHDALAFLTRLAPPRPSCTAASLSAAMPFFAPVGLVIGALCTLAAFAALWAFDKPTYGVAGNIVAAALAAWAWMVCEIWSTRGLHWDGLSDLGDAVGSGAEGERFWTILRDSRLGAFGALHMLVAFSGLWLSLVGHLVQGQWIALVLAPAWGRAAWRPPPDNRPSLAPCAAANRAGAVRPASGSGNNGTRAREFPCPAGKKDFQPLRFPARNRAPEACRKTGPPREKCRSCEAFA